MLEYILFGVVFLAVGLALGSRIRIVLGRRGEQSPGPGEYIV